MRKAKRFLRRQGEEDVCIASLARWNTQLKSRAELERRCQGMMQEVKLLSERQDVFRRAWSKTREGCRAEQTKSYHEQMFEEMKELEEKKSKEALLIEQKKAHLNAISK